LDFLYLYPIYTHIPQYAGITGYFIIPPYNRMIPLLTIWKEWSCKNIQLIKSAVCILSLAGNKHVGVHFLPILEDMNLVRRMVSYLTIAEY